MDVFPPDLSAFGLTELPTPDWGLTTNTAADVKTSALGDGYEFREPAGINYRSKSWSPTWSNLDPAVAEYLEEWLFQRLNLNGFKWVHPVTKVQYQVLATAVSVNYDTWGNGVLDAAFKQDFNPGV